MKQCLTCGRPLPLTDFYKHSQMADGHLNICKKCTKERVARHRQKNVERVRAYDRGRSNLTHRVTARTEYQERIRIENPEQLRGYSRAWTRRHPDQKAAITKAYRATHPNKFKAHYAVKYAVQTGHLEKQACERCGSLKVHGHHEDYSKPLEVMWLCAKHHKERHRELDALAAE